MARRGVTQPRCNVPGRDDPRDGDGAGTWSLGELQRMDEDFVAAVERAIANGQESREAAKALGVSKSAINRDVSQNGTDSVPKPDRQTKAERRAESDHLRRL
jgi:hypothetical protein